MGKTFYSDREKIKQVADYYGLNRQMNKLVEELGEAVSASSEAISMRAFHETNGKMRTENERLEHLIAELADVCVLISQLLYLIDANTPVDAYGIFIAAKDSGIKKTLQRIDHEMKKGEE